MTVPQIPATRRQRVMTALMRVEISISNSPSSSVGGVCIVLSLVNDKSIVIFGAGIIANRTIAYFGKERIECIIDNSKDRIGAKLQGIDIVSLEGYINDMSRDRDSQIVIAVGSNYASIIAEQLKNNGISEFCWFKPIENCVKETI